MRFCSIIISFSLLFFSCHGETEVQDFTLPLMQTPEGFPDLIFPTDNAYTPERWTLGKDLFYDTRFSSDNQVSCASCHLPAFAFGDTSRISFGANHTPGIRNAPSLANVGYHPYFLREGGVPTLEMQVLVPIEEAAEFNHNIVQLTEKLLPDTAYQNRAKRAYGQNINPYVITRAIANFERSLVSGTSPYDLYKSRKNLGGMTEDAIKGMELFFSDRVHCKNCHGGFNFTDYRFQNNGLYLEYIDPGRQRLTGKSEDLALFKTPSLRNVAITGPYMHDGSLSNLEEVIEHYDKGGKPHPHKNELIKPLGLKEKEKKHLKAFLESLTDEYFINNMTFRK